MGFFKVLLMLGLLAIFPGWGYAEDNGKVELGMNISLSRYFSPQIAFVDVFKHAKEWIPQKANGRKWKTKQSLDVDKNGWVKSLQPGQAAGTVMLSSLGGHYPGGEYLCLYDGQGNLEFGKDASIKSSSKGRIVLNVKPSDAGIYLKINDVDPQDPIRNIRVIMPGHEKSYREKPFYPVFLERLEGFKTLRFMRWGVNNSSYYTGWSDRATPDYYSQATNKDVAIEYMIELANTLKANPWFSVPHQADDEYMREFARLVKARLDPDLKAYLEYTNEVWNSMFPQSSWATKQGKELKLDENKNTGRIKFYSKRAGELFKIWEEEFGGNERLVRVLGSMAPNPWITKTMLEFGDTAKHTDAIAIAPYFGGQLGKPKQKAQAEKMTQEQLFKYLDQDIDRVFKKAALHKKIAKKYNLSLIAYEGGQHLNVAPQLRDNKAIVGLFIDVNRDPRMGELYKTYFDRWAKLGGGLFVVFDNVTSFSQYGSWGVQESLDQPISDAPKLKAIREYMGIQ